MKVRITTRANTNVENRTYTFGQVVDKEESEDTKKAWIESKIAEEVKDENIPVKPKDDKK
jgi:hypothetical protein